MASGVQHEKFFYNLLARTLAIGIEEIEVPKNGLCLFLPC